MVAPPPGASICLGRPLRDSGQSRVPEPPDRMTGVMRRSALFRVLLPGWMELAV
jgi:hypothetical protein